jgi:hypothetical protein
LRCVPFAGAWSDVGSWSALWAFLEKNQDGNVVQGQGDIMLENVRNSYVYGDHGCVALVGVENLIVVAMEDAILVASKEEAESIRKVVDRLKGNGHYQAMQHARVYRPWGWYQGLNQGDRYPGEMHHGEAESEAVAPEPSPPLRALGGRHRNGRGHARRPG